MEYLKNKYNIPEEKCTLDYHDIINNKEINAVSIGIPDQLHKQVAIEMLEADPHVGDSFRYENLFVIVASMDEERVTKLTVLVEQKPDEEEKND